MINVVNKRTAVNFGDNAIYIGRPSILGNPFAVSVYGHGVCIAMFRKWLWKQMQSDTEQHREILRLAELYKETGELTLVCWCKPKPCHGDVIANAVKYVMSTLK